MAGVLEDVRAEDFVEYFLFPEQQDMELVLTELNAKALTYTDNYIWHKDPFHLRINRASTTTNAENNQQGQHNEYY